MDGLYNLSKSMELVSGKTGFDDSIKMWRIHNIKVDKMLIFQFWSQKSTQVLWD